MTDVYKDLAGLAEWRGIVVPLLGREAGFQHDKAQHTYVFRDQQYVQALGARNWTFRYRIPFRQGIARSPYVDLFLEVFPRFLDACRDRSPGELYDPVLGLFRCECTSLEDVSDVQRRDGDDVTVEFLWSPEEGEIDLPAADLANLPTARQEGAALDEAVGEIFRSRQLPSPEPSINPLDAISGFLNQLNTHGQQVQAGFANYASKTQKIEDAVAKLEDPSLAPTIQAARNLRAAAKQREEKLFDPIGSIRSYTAGAATNVAAIAAAVGLSPEELLRQNPQLAASPEVPAGTVVRFLAKA